MSQRYDILDGDTTTARGQVIATSRAERMNDRAVAYEGDPVICRTCGTTGQIVCVGPRCLSRGPDGRQQALSGDWCVCQCQPAPLLIQSQDASSTAS
ncbi:PAAR domain-containing protein [Burkholderia stagnalis]|uniref:PAAR domain-containing protein n=1 Tax=Burkholderia stagnalis TaxID=1503054 RepID=UPI0009BD03C0|nr:PAAR domain-containing protein [Burkholderia stagnalis]